MGVLMRPLIFLSQIKVRSIFSEFFMKETIVAQATAPGRGGIGILRVSGPKAVEVAQAVLGKCPKPRMADYLPFKMLTAPY